MRFTAMTEGRNTLRLRELLDEFANNLWIPDHLTPEQATEFSWDYFKRTLAAEMKLLELACVGEEKEIGVES